MTLKPFTQSLQMSIATSVVSFHSIRSDYLLFACLVLSMYGAEHVVPVFSIQCLRKV